MLPMPFYCDWTLALGVSAGPRKRVLGELTTRRDLVDVCLENQAALDDLAQDVVYLAMISLGPHMKRRIPTSSK